MAESVSVLKPTSNMKVAWIARRHWLLAEMGEIFPSNVKKCCFRYDLVIGCAVYVTVEVYLWAILSLASIYTEFKMIENREDGAFQKFVENSSYYVTAFGSPSDDMTRAIICKLTRWLWRFHGKLSAQPHRTGWNIDFPLIRSFANRNQRIPRGRICALLYFRCDSFDWNFWGMGKLKSDVMTCVDSWKASWGCGNKISM